MEKSPTLTRKEICRIAGKARWANMTDVQKSEHHARMMAGQKRKRMETLLKDGYGTKELPLEV